MASEAQIKANQENAVLGGRPVASATLIKQEFRKALAERIKKDADKWIDAIQDSALGHWMEVKQADGTVKVYKTKPDPSAWQKGMDRAFGAPEQEVDLTSGGEKISSLRETLLILANGNDPSTRIRDVQGRERQSALPDTDAVQDIRSRLEAATSTESLDLSHTIWEASK